MTLASVQCPNCGSPMQAPTIGSTVACPACHSTLSIKAGSSGYPLAQLVAIGQDTRYAANQRALQQLQDHVKKLESDRWKLKGPANPVFMPWVTIALCTVGWIPAVIGLISVILDGGPAFLLPVTLVVAGAVFAVEVSIHNGHRREAEIRREANLTGLREVERDLAESQAKVEELTADLVKVAKEM